MSRGAIAAGSEATAEAGAAILRAGGNAADAAVGACFAVAAGEPTLTSLAGAGVMLHRSGDSGEIEFCDFFANAPGLGLDGARPEPHDFYSVEVNFGPAVQPFYVGAGSAAVPGAIPGLCTALERWGSMPLAAVIEPACEVLRRGVVLGQWQARAVGILEQIMLSSEAGRRQFGVDGRIMGEGDRYCLPELAETLEQLCRGDDWRARYRETIEEKILGQFGLEAGGWITRQDLSAYRVDFRPPLVSRYRGASIYTNPPPAAGGLMVLLMLGLLEGEAMKGLAPGSSEQIHALCRAMRVADEARAGGSGGLPSEPFTQAMQQFAALSGQPLGAGPRDSGGPQSTTHVSVIDVAGNAASVTFSYGEGNGVLIDGTGIMMNNLMGEEDLFPGGFHSWPQGQRLATMMSPTLVVKGDEVVVMGTGGANRIRTALIQVISNLLDHGMDVEHAVRAARVHFEDGVLNGETIDDPALGSLLAALGADKVVTFDEPNLFFGGVHLVRRRADGTLEGAGDLRRGGVCVVV
jgi:gamma-glutamyltranspeptidase / glutathione hydrolase